MSERSYFAPRLGFSSLGRGRFVIPAEVNFLLGKTAASKNFAEFGLGATLSTKKGEGIADFDLTDDPQTLSNEGSHLFYTLRAGYRHQKPEGGLMFRLGFTLLAAPNEPSSVLPFGGFSLGYSF
ncbi:hypothetical protein D9M68_916150 [compost metagenome]